MASRPLWLIELALLLVVVRLRLSRQGFQEAVGWATRVREIRRGRDDAEARATVEQVRDAARLVSRWHPVANKCLEQSLLVSRFLARRGIKAEMLLGVCKYPFESHAWVRWQDVELTDPPERHAERFRIIARF